MKPSMCPECRTAIIWLPIRKFPGWETMVEERSIRRGDSAFDPALHLAHLPRCPALQYYCDICGALAYGVTLTTSCVTDETTRNICNTRREGFFCRHCSKTQPMASFYPLHVVTTNCEGEGRAGGPTSLASSINVHQLKAWK